MDGISTELGDFNYDDLVVDVGRQTVLDREGRTLTFEEFVSQAHSGGDNADNA